MAEQKTMPQAEAQQTQAQPTPQAQPSELEIRAQNEMAMLKQTALKKQMQSKMKPKITEEEVRKASQILQKYKDGKKRLEDKIIANEEFWKLRQWNYMNDGKKDFKPATAWLWSCIQSRYSDAMDSYPTCNFQPRQQDDKAEAIKLSSIVPVILEQKIIANEEFWKLRQWNYMNDGNEDFKPATSWLWSCIQSR